MTQELEAMRVSSTWFRPLAIVAAVAALCLPLAAADKAKPVSPGNGTLYIGIFPNHFKVIDEATGKVTGTIPYKSGMPRRTAMTRDRKRFYTVEAQMEKVEIIDIASRKTVDTFTLSEGNQARAHQDARARSATPLRDDGHAAVRQAGRPVRDRPLVAGAVPTSPAHKIVTHHSVAERARSARTPTSSSRPTAS